MINKILTERGMISFEVWRDWISISLFTVMSVAWIPLAQKHQLHYFILFLFFNFILKFWMCFLLGNTPINLPNCSIINGINIFQTPFALSN